MQDKKQTDQIAISINKEGYSKTNKRIPADKVRELQQAIELISNTTRQLTIFEFEEVKKDKKLFSIVLQTLLMDINNNLIENEGDITP